MHAFSQRVKTTEVLNANNSSENRNKSRHDDDITIANAMNNELISKIRAWSAGGNGLLYHINSLFESSLSSEN